MQPEDAGELKPEANVPVVPLKLLPAVTRSQVAEGRRYPEYRGSLRRDFLYSCAYCTMSEHEANGIAFEIDHYEPQTAREDLVNDYKNLMYSCEVCNARKGDRIPPPGARADGKRFFRADEDVRSEHFRVEKNRIEGITNLGRFNADAVDLNRAGLQRLRELRRQLVDDNEYVHEGISALLSYPVDRIGRQQRVQILKVINEAVRAAKAILDDLDELLLQSAKSAVLPDEMPSQQEILDNKDRLRRLRGEEVMYPGLWRGRRAKRKIKKN